MLQLFPVYLICVSPGRSLILANAGAHTTCSNIQVNLSCTTSNVLILLLYPLGVVTFEYPLIICLTVSNDVSYNLHNSDTVVLSMLRLIRSLRNKILFCLSLKIYLLTISKILHQVFDRKVLPFRMMILIL